MGTDIHFKTYSPTLFSMRDLSGDGNNGNLPQYSGESALKNGPCYSSQGPTTPANGLSNYDKEVMKQTMLKQDAIFKDQVYQLHRLYKVQTDLTNQLKSKALSNFHIPAEAMQTSPLASQLPFQDAEQTWRVSSLPLMGSTLCRPSTSEVNHMPGSSPSTQFGVNLGDHSLLESKSVKVPNKLFGLELPAFEYHNNEMETEQRKNIQAHSGAGCSEGGIKLSLGSTLNPGWQCDTTTIKKKLRLADLNEPIPVDEKTSDPVPQPYPELLHLASNFIQNAQKGKNNGTHMNVRPLEEEEQKRRELFSYKFEAGQNKSSLNFSPSSFYPERFPKAPESKQAESSTKGHQVPPFPMLAHSKTEQWRERAICGNGISDSHNYNLDPGTSLHSHSAYLRDSQSDIITSSAPVASWMKQMSSFSKNPVAVQGLHCFKTSTPSSKASKLLLPSSEFIGETRHRHISSNSGSNSSLGSEGPYRNGVFNGTHYELRNASQLHFPSASEHAEGANCIEKRSLKSNEWSSTFPSRFLGTSSLQNNLMVIHDGRKNKDEPKGLPWLKANSASSNGLVKGRACSDELALYSSSGHPSHFKVGKENFHSSRTMQDISSTSCSQMADSQRSDIDEYRSSTKILGFSVYDNAVALKEQSTLTSAFKSVKYLPKAKDVHGKRSMNHFNLNLCTTEEDVTSSVKVNIEIDLEAPYAETLEKDPIELDPPVDSFKGAVEAIVLMSSACSAPIFIEDDPSDEHSSNSLHLLAEVVSLNTVDESDYFESMTLKLHETTEKEYTCIPWVPENPEVEETDTGTAVVLTRRRRGQARRGRQKRDFQRDILPGIATLSRHEVTEDIQAFEELMRVTGHPWETRIGRRSGTRSGRGRGRRQLPSSVPEIVQQPSNGDLMLEDKSLRGWGKTTRRPRRQRLPASTPLSSPTQA